VLVAALVCLAIVMALIGGMLLSALRTGRQLHTERDLRQCELLLAAGITRVANQTANVANYRGETWQLSADQIIGTAPGEVTIEVIAESAANQRQLHITAEYPLGSETSIRRSQIIHVPVTNR